MANIKDFIKKIGNSAVSLEEQQQALAQVEQTIIEAKQKRTEAIGKNAEMVVQALKTIEAKLEAKLEELNNTPAKQGIQGPAGKDGRDGKDGKNGRDGVNGKDGKDGKDGVDGNDGVSVVDAKIDFDGSLVVYLSNGNEIDCGQILQPEVAKNIIISSGGSGTSQVVTDTLVSLQNQINALTGIDGVLGDMAQQNANAVAITGGTINNTSIGATTPSTGVFSDLTDSGLTSGRVTYAGTGGNLRDASNFTYDGTNLQAGAIQNTPIGSTTASTGSFTTLNSTGGALNGTIGATTPSTGAFTTITGQTEVLRGTGQNLLTRSQDLLNAAWVSTATTVSATLYTDPLGGTTANNLIETATTNNHIIGINATVVAGLTYTFSVYLKKGIGATAPDWVQLSLSFAQFGTTYANFNLNTGVVGTTSGTVSSSITFVGNGWYRCSYTAICTTAGSSLFVVAFTNNSNGAGRLPSYAGATTSDMLVWGAQVEIGSVVNTYIPTTTTAVYGTPTLSFSGVSTLGLEQTGALYLQPAGTGAIQAQATTSTTAGGNARGANAVDWQTSRNSATQVANGQYSVIGGGANNTSSAFGSTVGGGTTNTARGNYNVVAGGNSNQADGNFNNVFSAVVGGYGNSANGYLNFVGGGYANSTNTTTAVTTQSGTMNGTTAVTLSGSNANIKVGQLIIGTSINTFPPTYVAAISGTSLTLSQNASGSSTSTLSFLTPHGIVVGGGNNQATGAYSFIGGGGDAGTAANRNVASGDWSFVGGGKGNTASGLGAIVVGGNITATGATGGGNLAGAQNSFVGSGNTNNATGIYSTVLNGFTCTANAAYSSHLGGAYGTARGIVGNTIISASSAPVASAIGVQQSALLVLGRQTTDATPTVLASDSNAAGTTNQVILPNNSAYLFKATVIAGVTGAGNTSGWKLEGVIKRGANAASTVLVGTVTTTVLGQNAGASGWAITATADTTNGGIAFTATGQAGTTIRWVCKVETTEMTY